MTQQRILVLVVVTICGAAPTDSLAQGSKTYPVTSYLITRYKAGANDSAYITLNNGATPVAYMYFQVNPPVYGHHSSTSDYVTIAFDINRFNDLVGILRTEGVDYVYGSWDNMDRVTGFILNSNSRTTFATTSPADRVGQQLPRDFREFEVRDGVLRIKGEK